MSNIILNGVDSDTVNGLLIQRLPPIIKPALRVAVEEIDGRDGDIVTPLGYSAYDRDLLIGLRRNFDLDEIIAYFNGSGEAVFSNEPDKIYRYRIIEQIDYEALGRLKQATVVFHCQPFKLENGETPVTFTSSETVINKGNVYARPYIEITGEGTVGIYLDGSEMLSLEMGASETTFVIDLEEQNAYEGSNLVNRQVTGDYSAFTLPVGSSVLSVSGTVSDVTVTNYSRWI